MANIEVFAGDTNKDRLGLSCEEYDWLVDGVTHICHVAWPLSGSRPLSAFIGQFTALRPLIDLATTICVRHEIRVGVQFVSSVTAVVYYHLIGSGPVPESMPAAAAALPTGYSKSKYVADLMLAKTL